MSEFERISVRKALKVGTSADAFFQQLMKWDSILGWPNPPVKLTKVELAKGSKLGQVPCTRLCYIDRSVFTPEVARSIPDCVSETLLSFDTIARTCLYMLDGTGPYGMRNYYATTEVDAIDVRSAQVTCSGRLDLPKGGPADAIRSMLLETYARGVIGGTAAMIGASVT